MIINITAKFSCDLCGMAFTVPLDPAHVPRDALSCYEIAEESIRWGHGYEDGSEDKWGSGSVVGCQHFCSRCTRRRDKKLSEAG